MIIIPYGYKCKVCGRHVPVKDEYEYGDYPHPYCWRHALCRTTFFHRRLVRLWHENILLRLYYKLFYKCFDLVLPIKNKQVTAYHAKIEKEQRRAVSK